MFIGLLWYLPGHVGPPQLSPVATEPKYHHDSFLMSISLSRILSAESEKMTCFWNIAMRNIKSPGFRILLLRPGFSRLGMGV